MSVKTPLLSSMRMVSAPPARLTMMASNVEQSNVATSVPPLRTSSMVVLPGCSRRVATSSSRVAADNDVVADEYCRDGRLGRARGRQEPQPHEKQPHDTSGRSMEPSQAERPASARGCRTAEREASGHGFVPRCICHPALTSCRWMSVAVVPGAGPEHAKVERAPIAACPRVLRSSVVLAGEVSAVPELSKGSTRRSLPEPQVWCPVRHPASRVSPTGSVNPGLT